MHIISKQIDNFLDVISNILLHIDSVTFSQVQKRLHPKTGSKSRGTLWTDIN